MLKGKGNNINVGKISNGVNKKIINWVFWILVLGGILLGVSVFALSVGPSAIAVKKIISIILTGKGTAEYSIILDIRLPRILLGFAIGGALALSGVILQGMFRNPLVEPYTLVFQEERH